MQDLGLVQEQQEKGMGRADVFPHDRVVFFSDAVFAIAITLLAIELKLPDAEMVERMGEGTANGHTLALFIAYFVSFLVTATFWMGHMQTWRHVRHVSGRLVWGTVWQLMFVALMPFATREYSESVTSASPGRFAFYAVVLATISFFGLLTRVWVARQESLSTRLGAAQARWFLVRNTISMAVFLLAIPVAYLWPNPYSAFFFALIWPASFLGRRLILGRAG